MTIVGAVLGAVLILGFIIGGVMMWMRKNTGGEGGYAPAAGKHRGPTQSCTPGPCACTAFVAFHSQPSCPAARRDISILSPPCCPELQPLTSH
nr:H-2 class I histocompatibility antigen, TLA(B) alpha chain-like [Peromyscus maniculatus bairdii]